MPKRVEFELRANSTQAVLSILSEAASMKSVRSKAPTAEVGTFVTGSWRWAPMARLDRKAAGKAAGKAP